MTEFTLFMAEKNRSKRLWRRVQYAVLLVVGLFGAACGRAQSETLPGAEWAAPDTNLFEDTNVVRISITVQKSDTKKLRNYSWRGGGGERPEVKATVVEGQTTYTNVALHLKGAAGSFRPFDERPALTLNFDKFAKGQRFHGLQKFSLNNSVQDGSFLNEKICRELFAAAGVPVPRSDYAVVTLNGRKLGLYVLVEGYNKQFLKRYYKNVTGNLYDGGFCRDINETMDVNSGDKPDDQSERVQLVNAATASGDRWKNLQACLDIDRFVSLIAMEVIQCHWDGYTMNRNNYRLYTDRDSGKMVFMPHGLDQMFGTGERPQLDAPIVPRAGGLVAAAVLGTREGRALYLQRLGALRTNAFQVEAITNRLREIERRLRPVLAEFGPVEPRNHAYRVSELCRNIAARAASIDEQLSAPPPETEFNDEGIMKLSGWRPRVTSGGGAAFEIVPFGERQKTLRISAARDGGSASWRTRIVLPQGRYRLEGSARTSRVQGEGGAILRISGGQNRPLRGDTDWTLLSFPFEVHEFNQEVELVCELRGNRGEAWFDVQSLKLRRLQ